MADENTLIEIDSLCANEFALEIDGETVSGVFRIAGFQPFQFVSTGDTKTVLITKMVQRDPNNAFNKWVEESIQTLDQDVNPTRDITIVAIDDGVVVRRWTLKNAFLASLAYSDFDTASSELVEEQALVQYAAVEMQWGA